MLTTEQIDQCKKFFPLIFKDWDNYHWFFCGEVPLSHKGIFQHFCDHCSILNDLLTYSQLPMPIVALQPYRFIVCDGEIRNIVVIWCGICPDCKTVAWMIQKPDSETECPYLKE